MRALPVDEQQEVLGFVEFLRQRAGAQRPRRRLEGLWADLDVHVSEEDIPQARRERWGSFSREDV